MFTQSIDRQISPGPVVQFTCPKCGQARSRGNSYELHDKFMALHFIPLWSTRTTYVACTSCRANLSSRLDIEELALYRDADVTPYLAYESSFVFKFAALAAVLLWWAPIVGLGLTVLALAGTWRVPGWPRTLAIVSAPLSLAMTVLGAVALVLAE